MAGPQIVIIADDLTGAADTAGAFASRGLSVVLSLSGLATPNADVLALSTDCRDAGSGDVQERVLATLRRARSQGEPKHWFHKVDSALRGHPGAEISLIMNAIGCTKAVCVPALPAQGRAVIDGQILINGHPLHLTTLGEGKSTSSVKSIVSDYARMQVQEVDLHTLRNGQDVLRTILDSNEPALVIVDSETEEDLRLIAGLLVRRPDVLPVGSAGLGAALSAAYDFQSGFPAPAVTESHRTPVFCVAGSAHHACARQVDYSHGRGVAVVRPFQIHTRWVSREIAELQERTGEHLQAGRDTILTTAGYAKSAIDGQRLADQLAWIAAGPILDELCGSLILTGGDIAAATCVQLDADFLWIGGEVSPAIPWGSLGDGPRAGIPVVTKAGSFGGHTAISDAMTFLHSMPC